ncbi:Glyoxylate/hydroxypyruvate reductase (D-isomer-specific 2-hydroxy acid dehydrogenase superfamily) [Handroanthus impetiginosus]|uniref:Glyoxylate/hydroxypyruvate reductase (D-isomer-specific 2-hydroxy acid dehydrogenase superfamily) n=1 Tax=Handroanthus impetiginosus TaxID=429701 RepID=A0A2G9G6N0_9LAMI|nr:Glyoxylate/hydroxypyruvate reductase (D-isomer-specific 2-hydroxy acid dehydrogenase superfamily) [Handroanthus impetiginosus]
MPAAVDIKQSSETLPLLLLHRFPSFELSFFPVLKTKYTVLDLHADPPGPSFPILSKSVRVMLCVGPTALTSEDLDRYPAVECVVGSSAGINHFDLAACRRRGIRVTSAGDASSDDVADYAVGLALDVLRRVSVADRFVRAGSWPFQKEYTLGSKVSGKRVGIVGLGSIGLRVAKRFEGFNCSIAYNSRKIKSHVSYPYYANVGDLASNSDILIVCCALTNETFHVINKDVMRALGNTGIIVNVGRGALIDEKELVELLVRGDLGGAGLDVFEHEPYVPEELFSLDNVVLSPHNAVITLESFAALEELVLANIEAFFSNKPLRAEVELH